MPGLTHRQRLTLQQLRLLDWADQRTAARSDGVTAPRLAAESDVLPERWKLTNGITLAPWQNEATGAWFAARGHGMIKVVTGAGKTIVALAIAERLQRSDPELRVAIVVPTIVLMEQWHRTLKARSNLPDASVGRLGGGYSDDFSDSRRILIAVLASARKTLPGIVRSAGVSDHLLLIADECHRVGAPEMSAVLDTASAYTLGLSATPERDDDLGDDLGTRVSRPASSALGGIVYEMTFAEAIRAGVLPPFEVQHFGLPLDASEARRYQALTRSINEARRELLASSASARKTGGGDQLLSWARSVSARSASRLSGLAAQFVNDVTRRKQLLYRAASRIAVTRTLVRQAIVGRRDARVILFHESIDEVVDLFDVLMRDKIPVVMEHSELPTELRDASLELFRAGVAQVIVSARSLIEGFDVPEADLGIIVASSSSPRQRIQSIGRVLRKPRGDTRIEKSSRICVLYVRDSVDEAIYERQNWDDLIGPGRSRYFTWDPPSTPLEQIGPPRSAMPEERDIDFSQLAQGDTYPGRYEGAEFSADSFGNVIDPDGRVASNPQDVPRLVHMLKGQSGRFKVTALRHAILVLVPEVSDGWRTLYGGVLESPFQFARQRVSPESVGVSGLTLGSRYDGPVEPATQLRFRQRAGGVIAKRVPGGEVFARGPEADRLVGALRELARTHRPVTRVLLNKFHHAVWIEDGMPRFIAALDDDLEFPGEHA
jgi:superfamily II DNA or RNA helicase